MPRMARQMVGPKVDELIDDLKRAYADEWLAYYYYKAVTELVEGIESDKIASQFEEIAAEELEHADELAERIAQLGGEIPRDLSEVVELANCKTFAYPSQPDDWKGFLQAGIEAEQCAMDVYNTILTKVRDDIKDPLTFHTIRHILQEEVHHEDEFITLLG